MPNFEFPTYLQVDEANEYFGQRLNSDVWFIANENDKAASLVQATRAIDNLNFIGVKFSSTQKLAFPRWQPDPLSQRSDPGVLGGYLFYNAPPYAPVEVTPAAPIIPQDILLACCEIAIVLLDGFDFEQEYAALNTSHSQFAGVKETYGTDPVRHLRHGIASSLAWVHLLPWLADTNSFTLSRVN